MNDNDHDDELFERARNFRVELALSGGSMLDRDSIARELVALLQSPQEIARSVRTALADAIMRGLESAEREGSNVGPCLEIRSTGERGRIAALVRFRNKWCDAVEAEQDHERVLSRKLTSEEVLAIAREFSIDFDMMKKARAYFKSFIAEYDDPNSRLNQEMRDTGNDEMFVGEDHYYCARSLFIERSAREHKPRKRKAKTDNHPPSVI